MKVSFFLFMALMLRLFRLLRSSRGVFSITSLKIVATEEKEGKTVQVLILTDKYIACMELNINFARS